MENYYSEEIILTENDELYYKADKIILSPDITGQTT